MKDFIDFIDIRGNKKVLHVGDKVRYIPNHANKDRDHEDCEIGIVTSLAKNHAFVRYEKQHPSANGQATNYSDLEVY